MSGSGENSKDGGERVLAASRRPDGTLRKPVRIRAGYTPQDEVAVYQSKAVQFKQNMPLVPPGYDAEDAARKPKTKAAKKNEKRKERKQQVRLSESVQGSSSTESVTPELNQTTKQDSGQSGLKELESKFSATSI